MITRIVSFVGWLVYRAVGATLSISEIRSAAAGPEAFRGTVLYALWHGDQFVALYHHRSQGIAIMASRSRDGELIVGVLERFKYRAVRGSSTRGGGRALADAIRKAKKGICCAITVDGPKGPRHEVKPGIALLAQKSGCPVIPVAAAYAKAWTFSSWDRFRLPHPFTRTAMLYGDPVTVAPEDGIEQKRKQIQDSLLSLSALGDMAFRVSLDAAPEQDEVTLASYLRAHPRPKILLIQPSRIGDVIFTLPSLAAIRAAYPSAWIGWVVDERCAPLLEGNPLIDEVVVFDRHRLSLSYLRAFSRHLREKRIDVSIDFHGLFKSAFLAMLAGARFRIGSAATRGMKELSWAVSKQVLPDREDSHCVERHLTAARFIGAAPGPVSFPFAVSPSDSDEVERLLKETNIDDGRPLVAVHPGGGWTSRRWAPGRFAALIDRISAVGAVPVLIGGKEGGAGEKGLNEEILSIARSKAADLTGRLSLRALCAFYRRARAFVGNEAGPMHLAVAIGIPVVGILGPTDPGRTGPYIHRERGSKVTIVRHRVPCQPCRNRSCSARTCMDGVTVDMVFEALKKYL